MILPIDECYVEVWGMHQALIRMGFMAEELFLETGLSASYGGRCIHVTLMAQGLVFRAAVARIPDGKIDERVVEEWSAVVELINRSDEQQRERLWKRSSIGADTALFQALAVSLIAKGFDLTYADGEGTSTLAATMPWTKVGQA
jgi:hypothetical protein